MPYYRMPYICKDEKCFCCNRQLTETKTLDLVIFHIETYQSKYVSYPVLYCSECGLYQIDRKIFSQIKKENKFWTISLINKSPNLNLSFIKEQMTTPLDFKLHKGHSNLSPKIRPAQSQQQKKTKHWVWYNDVRSAKSRPEIKRLFNKYKVVKRDMWKYVDEIHSMNPKDYRMLNKCPICQKILFPAYTLVPVTVSDCAEIDGKECISCNRIYVEDCEELKKLLIDNIFAESYTLNGRCYAYYTEDEKRKNEEQKRKAQQRESMKHYPDYISKYPSIVFFIVLINDYEKIEYGIVEKKAEENLAGNVLYFKNELARELIAASTIDAKLKMAQIYNKLYHVLLCIPKQKKLEYLPPYITLVEDNKYDNYYIKEDVLLYSPFTQKYEIVKMAIINSRSYWGINEFRKFVHKYGRPAVDIEIDTSSDKKSDRFDFDKLREQSVLKLFGYTVNATDNKSARMRQAILGDIVDLELMSVQSVIYMLNFFIGMHTNVSYYPARIKWKEDLEFIQNYTVNPDRFLIIGQKRKWSWN